MRKGTVFTGVCLSALTLGGGGGTPSKLRMGGVPYSSLLDGGGYPSQVQTEGGNPIPGLDGGYPIPCLDRGYTHSRSGQWGGGGTLHPGLEGYAPPDLDGVHGVTPPLLGDRAA